MDPLSYLILLITDLNNLSGLIQTYGSWTYFILFLIIFCETGLVVTFFFPGDSLLFIAGTFSANGSFEIFLLITLLAVAAVAGDTVNYQIGRFVGPRAFTGKIRFLKKEYLDEAQRFYEKHGKITIVLARFIPVIRTFAPFVAGIGKMNYWHFLAYNVIGGITWIILFTVSGFFFGNIPFVRDNFTFVIYAIIFVSLLPAITAFIRQFMKGRKK